MIEVIENEYPELLEIKMVEKLSEADLSHIKPVLEGHVEEHKEPSLLLTVENFSGWNNAKAFFKDLELDVEFLNKFKRVALVGDAQWMKWGLNMIAPAASSELKYFPMKKETQAHAWVQEA